MNEKRAAQIARATGGDTWQSGGNIWLSIKTRADGRCVVISEDAVCEYESGEAFDDGREPLACINLA